MPGKKKRVIDHPEVVRRFAARLRELRASRGMTQVELGRRATVTATYLTRLENAAAAPGLDTLGRLADALGCTVADLVPAATPADPTEVAREQVRRLTDTLVRSADSDTLLLASQFLARLVETAR